MRQRRMVQFILNRPTHISGALIIVGFICILTGIRLLQWLGSSLIIVAMLLPIIILDWLNILTKMWDAEE